LLFSETEALYVYLGYMKNFMRLLLKLPYKNLLLIIGESLELKLSLLCCIISHDEEFRYCALEVLHKFFTSLSPKNFDTFLLDLTVQVFEPPTSSILRFHGRWLPCYIAK
jgi:hypothetical protein